MPTLSGTWSGWDGMGMGYVHDTTWTIYAMVNYDGTWSASDIPDGTYDLIFDSGGYGTCTPDHIDDVVVSGSDVTGLDCTWSSPTWKISGYVKVWPGTTGIETAKVVLSPVGGGDDQIEYTDENGYYEFDGLADFTSWVIDIEEQGEAGSGRMVYGPGPYQIDLWGADVPNQNFMGLSDRSGEGWLVLDSGGGAHTGLYEWDEVDERYEHYDAGSGKTFILEGGANPLLWRLDVGKIYYWYAGSTADLPGNPWVAGPNGGSPAIQVWQSWASTPPPDIRSVDGGLCEIFYGATGEAEASGPVSVDGFCDLVYEATGEAGLGSQVVGAELEFDGGAADVAALQAGLLGGSLLFDGGYHTYAEFPGADLEFDGGISAAVSMGLGADLEFEGGLLGAYEEEVGADLEFDGGAINSVPGSKAYYYWRRQEDEDMPLLIKAGETTASRRRVGFFLLGTDLGTPITGEVGGQPQISTDGGSWTDTGIGVLVEIGLGYYYAELTAGAVATAGQVIHTRYQSASTAESPGETVQIVAFDPHAIAGLGLTNLDAKISDVKARTDNLPNSPAAVGSAMTLAAGAIQATSWAANSLPEGALSQGARDAIGEALLALLLADNAAVAGSLGEALLWILQDLFGKKISDGTAAAGSEDVYAQDGVTVLATKEYSEVGGVFTRETT